MKPTEYIEQFTAEAMAGKSPNTIKAYRASLNAFSEWLAGYDADLATYGRIDVQDYVSYLQTVKRRQPSGINREMAAIKAYSRYANKAEAVEHLRMTKAVKATETAPEWLPKNKYKEILRKTDRKANKRDHAIVSLLLYAGIRVSELCNANREDYTGSERKGSIRVIGKGNKERIIPLCHEARHALDDYMAQRSDNEQALFTSSLGKRISVRTVQAMLKEYEVHPHQLRHTFVKNLVDAGVPLATIQSMSGHSSAEMIAWYSKPSEEDKRNAIDKAFD